jgi:hypothetical protein
VVDNLLNQTLLLEVGDRTTGQRSVDLHSVDEGRGGDDFVGGDLLHDSVAGVRDEAKVGTTMSSWWNTSSEVSKRHTRSAEGGGDIVGNG